MRKIYGDINGDRSETFWKYFVGNNINVDNTRNDKKTISDSKVCVWLERLAIKTLNGVISLPYLKYISKINGNRYDLIFIHEKD